MTAHLDRFVVMPGEGPASTSLLRGREEDVDAGAKPRHDGKCQATLVRIGLLLLLGGCMHDPPQSLPPTAGMPCAPWFNYPADTHSNRESPFLGCANDQNLAAMVAHPEELVQGRALAPADGEKTARAVETWREGKEKPLPESEPAAPIIQLPGFMAPAPTTQ